MAIIVVGGSAKNVGKTTLVCGLIAALDSLRLTAVKITTDAHHGLAPIYEEKCAGPATDTARYIAAGAERAFLLTGPPERDLAEALEEFWPLIGRGANLIFESNRVMNHLNVDTCLMVRENQPEKPRFTKCLNLSTVHFVDAHVVRDAEDHAFGWEFGDDEPSCPIFHLKDFAHISDEMKGWLMKRPGLAP